MTIGNQCQLRGKKEKKLSPPKTDYSGHTCTVHVHVVTLENLEVG